MTKNAALITGGAKRIGCEVALNLAAQGYDILISYNNSKADAQKLATEISHKFSVQCEIFQCDLNEISQVKELAEFTKKTFPHWNLLINNASIFNKSEFVNAPESELFDNLNIHLVAPMILSQEFTKHVGEKEGEFNIVNFVDKNITRYDTKYFYYLLSKKFLAEFTKMLSLQLAPRIRVNAIAPGFILNSVNENNPDKETEILLKKIPLQQKGKVENIVQTVDFLLQNNFITGQIFFIDGGASLNHAG